MSRPHFIVLVTAVVLSACRAAALQHVRPGQSLNQWPVSSQVTAGIAPAAPTQQLVAAASAAAATAAPVQAVQHVSLTEPGDQHKSLWPMDRWDVAVCAAVALTVFIAAGGGIGGGAVFVPLLVLGSGFSTHRAVALSNIAILGGATANFAVNMHRTHPRHPCQPLVNWDIILVMEPATILSALVGGYLNKLLPVWFENAALALLLALVTANLALRGARTFAAESKVRQLEAAEGVAQDLAQLRQPLLQLDVYDRQLQDSECGCESKGQQQGQQGQWDKAQEQQQQQHGGDDTLGVRDCEAGCSVSGASPPSTSRLSHLSSGAPRLPWRKFTIMALLSSCVVASDTVKAYMVCGSWQYWAVVLSIVPVALAVTAGARCHLLQRLQREAMAHEQWGQCAAQDHAGDIRWTRRNTVLYPFLCSAAGLAAGLFGVGGGIVKAPLMLSLGVCPEVAAATSATMILFTAGAASVVYVNFGQVLWDYGALFLAIGFVLTFAGQLATYQLVRLMGRRSVIIFAMALLMLLATAAAGYQAYVTTVTAAEARVHMWQWGSICGGVA